MSRKFNDNLIGTKYHSNSADPPKFLVQFEAKYLPQIAPEAVSEHEYVKNFLGGGGGACPQTPLEVFGFFWICHCATPPNQKLSRSTLGGCLALNTSLLIAMLGNTLYQLTFIAAHNQPFKCPPPPPYFY